MKHTPDNSFDKAFRERLAEATVAPSEHVWETIAARLEQKKPKKRIAVAWFSVAASLVLVSAIWWLSTAPPNADAGLAKVPPAVEKPLQQSSSVVLEQNISLVQEKKQQVVRHTSRAVGLVSSPAAAKPAPLPSLVSDTPAAQAEPIANFVKASPVEIITTNAAILPEIPATDAKAPVAKRSKKRIRSLSDLVNFVVAKVDDREEKVLETSNDGAILSLTALNVGPIKFKKNNTEK